MVDSTKERAKGVVDQAKGRMERTVGRFTGDRGRQVHGAVDEAIGKLEQAIGELRCGVGAQVVHTPMQHGAGLPAPTLQAPHAAVVRGAPGSVCPPPSREGAP